MFFSAMRRLQLKIVLRISKQLPAIPKGLNTEAQIEVQVRADSMRTRKALYSCRENIVLHYVLVTCLIAVTE